MSVGINTVLWSRNYLKVRARLTCSFWGGDHTAAILSEVVGFCVHEKVNPILTLLPNVLTVCSILPSSVGLFQHLSLGVVAESGQFWHPSLPTKMLTYHSVNHDNCCKWTTILQLHTLSVCSSLCCLSISAFLASTSACRLPLSSWQPQHGWMESLAFHTEECLFPYSQHL